jgi:hypothetical protein
MLDYDCCRSISLDREGVEQAVNAFYRNDPFFPRPFTHRWVEEDGRLWETFRGRFLKTNAKILGEEETELAELWVELVEEERRVRKERAEGVRKVEENLEDMGM